MKFLAIGGVGKILYIRGIASLIEIK